jgi:hypothetical protein
MHLSVAASIGRTDQPAAPFAWKRARPHRRRAPARATGVKHLLRPRRKHLPRQDNDARLASLRIFFRHTGAGAAPPPAAAAGGRKRPSSRRLRATARPGRRQRRSLRPYETADLASPVTTGASGVSRAAPLRPRRQRAGHRRDSGAQCVQTRQPVSWVRLPWPWSPRERIGRVRAPGRSRRGR